MPRDAHRYTYRILLTLIFLLPIFFIPGGAPTLPVAKSAILALATVLALITFSWEVWSSGRLSLPWHPILISVVLLPLVYLVSALVTFPSALSLFGYNLEIGTFGFILMGSVLLILSSIVFIDAKRVVTSLVAFTTSLLLVLIFSLIKILSDGDVLVWGNFVGNMGNPVGRWTDLAMSFSLLVSITILVICLVSLSKKERILGYVIFALTTALLMIIGFSVATAFALVTAIAIYLYLSLVEEKFDVNDNIKKPLTLPIILGLVSLLFLINPTISATRGSLGDIVSGAFQVQNTDVRPSFSTTLNISKAILSSSGSDALLGSGPNTFARDWLVHKPADVNTTPFWSITFPFGVGFLPTQISSTGILGTIVWITFLVMFVMLLWKAFTHWPNTKSLHFNLSSVTLVTTFIWIAMFFYVPSTALLATAFIFTGIFLAILKISSLIPLRQFDINMSPSSKRVWTLLLALSVFGALALGSISYKKFMSAYHFRQAVQLSSIDGVSLDSLEEKVLDAIAFAPLDIHYLALSRINFARAQRATTDQEGTQEENLAIFQSSISNAITRGRLAADLNPQEYQNWINLGQIYAYLSAEPLKVVGAYESALVAFSEAKNTVPTSPEIDLFLANLELAQGNVDSARSHIRSALALKQDYTNAHIALAQLELSQNNLPEAIQSADILTQIVPNNPGLRFEVGLLKYNNQDYTGALSSFNQALSIVPDYANAKYYRALTLIKLGREEEARPDLEALNASNPDNAELQALLEELNDEDGK